MNIKTPIQVNKLWFQMKQRKGYKSEDFSVIDADYAVRKYIEEQMSQDKHVFLILTNFKKPHCDNPLTGLAKVRMSKITLHI